MVQSLQNIHILLVVRTIRGGGGGITIPDFEILRSFGWEYFLLEEFWKIQGWTAKLQNFQKESLKELWFKRCGFMVFNNTFDKSQDNLFRKLFLGYIVFEEIKIENNL